MFSNQEPHFPLFNCSFFVANRSIHAYRKDIETWSCMVYKDDMRHWPQNSLDPPVNPPPIIEAFYDNFDTEANPMINATLGGSNIGDTLQRIVIKSDILRNELDNITSVRSALPFVYVLLVMLQSLVM